MVERLEKLQAQHPGIDLFVRWNIRGTGPLVNRLRPNSLADELLVDLRRKFGERSPYAVECFDSRATRRSACRPSGTTRKPASAISSAWCAISKLHETPFDLRHFLPENVRDEFLESDRHDRCGERPDANCCAVRRSSASTC